MVVCSFALDQCVDITRKCLLNGYPVHGVLKLNTNVLVGHRDSKETSFRLYRFTVGLD